jgi:hypothetical protein
VASSGNVTDEVIQEYIRLQEGGEPKDGGENFRVEGESANDFSRKPTPSGTNPSPLGEGG